MPFEAIAGIDMDQWERKGVAYVDYQTEGDEGVRRLMLDDFIYERVPTDLIVKRIEAYLKSTATDDEAPQDEAVDESEGDKTQLR